MFFEMLTEYREVIEGVIDSSIDSFGSQSPLRDAIEYGLKNGGKRLRPAIVLMVSEALGQRFDVSQGALAVEFFHTASLIADDLPCMDDDDERRNCPSLHKAYDEATAILATYALIAAGYERIGKNAQNAEVLSLAVENAAYNAGIFGVTGGQFLDLYPSSLDEAMVREVMARKTGALFELSFVLGWLFGGGETIRLEEVKVAAHRFGLIFQIIDDFGDFADDVANERKINYPAVVGAKKAKRTLSQEFVDLKNNLRDLGLDSQKISAMVEFLENEAQEATASFSGVSV